MKNQILPDDLSAYTEIGFGPAFHVEPLRGFITQLVGPASAGESPGTIVFTLPPAESEFDTHTLAFASCRVDGPYLTLFDADGGIIAGLE